MKNKRFKAMDTSPHNGYSPFRTWQILVVDDDATIRELVREMLQLFGQEVDIASSVQDALDRLATKSYNLVITDFNMPDVNGSVLVKTLKHRGSDAFVAMVTGAELSVISREFSSGEEPDMLVAKPFGSLELENVLHALERFA